MFKTCVHSCVQSTTRTEVSPFSTVEMLYKQRSRTKLMDSKTTMKITTMKMVINFLTMYRVYLLNSLKSFYLFTDPLDDDKCYHACNSESNRTIIDVDLYKLFRKEVESRQDANADDSLSFSLSLFSLNNSRFSIINSWPLLKSSTAASSSRFTKLIEINNQRRFNELSTRFSEYQECIFSFPSSKANLFTFDLLLYYSFVLFMSVQRIFNFNL